jgi:coenzyme PQQ precursor peptide PqqA
MKMEDADTMVEAFAELETIICPSSCIKRSTVLRSDRCDCLRQITWETRMTWKTPKIVEVPVGMEINMYVCATRK